MSSAVTWSTDTTVICAEIVRSAREHYRQRGLRDDWEAIKMVNLALSGMRSTCNETAPKPMGQEEFMHAIRLGKTRQLKNHEDHCDRVKIKTYKSRKR